MRSDTVRNWAPAAEVISAVAVVVTLIFVATEMRSNTNALQAQTYQVLIQQLNDFRRIGLSDPDLRDLRRKYLEGGLDSLNLVEQDRMRTMSSMAWSIFESAYYANERGVLGEPEWERFEIVICRNYRLDKPMWTASTVTPIPEALTPTFVSYVTESC